MTAQQLKNSILQMAVQGKLVPQDPNDEPASVLLERIREEKEQLIKEGKIKREKNPSVIFRGADNTPYEKIGDGEAHSIADEVPFDIPNSWEWARLGTLMSVISDGTHKTPTYVDNGIPFLSVQNISKGYFDLSKIKYITEDEHAKLIERVKPQINDILFCRIGTLGKAIKCTLDCEFSIFVSLGLLRPINPELADFIVFAINSPIGDRWIQDNKVGGGTHTYKINLVDIPNMLIPIPPIDEQKRIFAKLSEIDSFLKKYDIAEFQISKLNNSFPDQLKKSILQHAVQGKLVPQDPDDEPASVLLERIRAEKQRLVNEGKIKKDKSESIIFRRDNSHYEKRNGTEICIDKEIPFEIPESWAWCRLKSLCLQASTGPFGSMLHKNDYAEEGVPLVNPADIVNSQISDFRIKRVSLKKAAELSASALHAGDVIIGRRGEMGRSAVVQEQNNNWLCGTGCFFVKTCSGFMPEYLVFLLSSPYIQSALIEHSVGTTMNNLNHSILGELLIPLPPEREQSAILLANNKACETILKFPL